MGERAELAPLRRKNLQKWMDEQEINRTELANRLEVGRAYVSLLFTRHLGEKAARSIERKLFLPLYSLDRDPDESPGAVEEWELPSSLPFGAFALVPRIAVQLAAGSGSIVETEEPLPPLAFRAEWLQKKAVTSKSNLRIVSVHGDSMAPYLNSGDIVLVDTGQTEFTDNAIFAIEHANEVRIKRISKRFDGGVLIRSDAPGYPEESLSPKQAKDLRCLGKILWRAG